MSSGSPDRLCWRVGYQGDPLGFVPHELYVWNHRFDDRERSFRTIYVAELAETALREVLADFRPKLSAIQRFRELMGAEAELELAGQPISAAWRRQHVLAPVRLELHGPMCDLLDGARRHAIEERHADLLVAHGMEHLDLHEVTTSRRAVTQAIATSVYHDGAAAIRFPSCLDGRSCIAVFEGRGDLRPAAQAVALTDPPPEALLNVAAEWELTLEASPKQQ